MNPLETKIKALSFDVKRQFILGLAVISLLGIFILKAPMSVSSDGTRYLIGAKFLSEGRGYSAYGFDSQEIEPQIQWPPLLSLFAAGLMKTGSLHEIDALKLINFFSLLIYYAVFFRFAMLLFQSDGFRFAAQGIITLTPFFWQYLNEALSECLFLALLSLVLLLTLEASRQESERRRALLILGAGIFTALLCLTRYAGVFIAGGCLLFMAMARRPGRKNLIQLFLYAAPPLFAMSLWLLRNRALSGYFSSLEQRLPRPPVTHFFLEQAEFVRAVFEALLGYNSYLWNPPWLRWIPTILWLAGLCLLGINLVRIEKNRPSSDKFKKSFCSLILCLTAVYLAGLNWIKLKYGIGAVIRYFPVLNPLIFLSMLAAFEVLAESRAEEKRKRFNSLMGILCVFFVAGGFFHSFNLAKQLYGAYKKKPTTAAEPRAWMPGFENSSWVYDLLLTTVQRSDILISNNPTFLMYAAKRPCRSTFSYHGEKALGFKGFDKPTIALEEAKARGSDVYIILEKKYPCLAMSGTDCAEYLKKLRYEVVREDPLAIAVRLAQ